VLFSPQLLEEVYSSFGERGSGDGKKTLLSAVARGAGKNSSKLEGEFERQLNAARAPPPRNGLPIPRRGGADDALPVPVALPTSRWTPQVRKVEAVDSRSAIKAGRNGLAKWVIGRLKKSARNCILIRSVSCGGLIDSEVQLFKGWTAQRVATLIAK